MHPDRRPYITKFGVITVPIYYRDVPERDPERDGSEWYEQTLLNLGEKGFNQEHGIDFASADGRLVYPIHDRRIHILREPIELQKHWFYIFSIDPGVGVTAALFQAMTPQGIIINIDQYYAGNLVKESEAISAKIHAERIIEKAQALTDQVYGRHPNGESKEHWKRMFDIALMDPNHGWRLNDDLSYVSDRYIDAGIDILIRAGKDLKGSIEKVKELEEPHPGVEHPEGIIWYDNFGNEAGGAPLKYSFPHLGYDETGYYLMEKENWRYPDKEELDKRSSRFKRDIPVDKDDHLMACERYGCVYLVDAPKELIEHKVRTKDDEFYRKATANPQAGRFDSLFRTR